MNKDDLVIRIKIPISSFITKIPSIPSCLPTDVITSGRFEIDSMESINFEEKYPEYFRRDTEVVWLIGEDDTHRHYIINPKLLCSNLLEILSSIPLFLYSF